MIGEGRAPTAIFATLFRWRGRLVRRRASGAARVVTGWPALSPARTLHLFEDSVSARELTLTASVCRWPS